MTPEDLNDAMEHEGRRDDEDVFEEVLAEYIDRLNRGEMLDEEIVRAEHPEIGPEIWDRLEVFQTVGAGACKEEPLGTLGDYALRRQIGRGGMGVVYEAWENSMDRSVALKVLPAGVAADPQASARFLREAQTAGKLSHPNVVPVYFTGVKEQTPFYAMEYVEGETLAQILGKIKEADSETKTPFGKKDNVEYFARVADAFAEVADGLQHAHSKGVTHRDIKPSNLILDGDGRLRILDFGLARLEGQESITFSGDVVGTPLYMSPEQALRKKIPVDHRTDVYSLGATMYQMLTGRPPFKGKDHQDTLTQIIERDPMAPRKVNPRVPQDLETIVLKCLRKDSGDRYGTAEALGQDLRRFARGDPVEARSQGKWERWSRRLRRHRVRLAVATLAGIAALTIGLVTWLWKNAEEEAWRLLHDDAVRSAAQDIFDSQLTIFGDYGEGVDGLGNDTLFAFRAMKFKRGRKGVEETLHALERVADAVPLRPGAPYYLALTYRLLGEEDEAMREAERALSREPDFVPAQVLAAEIDRREFSVPAPVVDGILSRYRGDEGWRESWLLAYRHARAGNWGEAASAYDRLILFWRKHDVEPYVGFAVEALMGRGIVRLHQKNYPGAIRDFAAVRGLWPRLPEAAIVLGVAYHRAGEEGECEAVFEDLRATSSEGRQNEVATWIASVYGQLHDGKRCGAWAERVTGWEKNRLNIYTAFFRYHREVVVREAGLVLEKQPEDLHARLALAWVRLGMQWGRGGPDWDEKRREVLALAGETAAIYCSAPLSRCVYAMALHACGRYEEALDAAEGALDLQRRIGLDRHGPYVTLAAIHRSRGDTVEAVKILHDAAERFPRSSSVRYDLALTLEKARRYGEALASFEKMARPGRRATRARARIAGLLNRAGRYEEAVEQARQSLERPPRNTAAHEHLAFALWKLGHTDEALEAVDEGIEKLPGREGLHLVRGWILEATGQVEDAAKEFRAELRLRPDGKEARESLERVLERHPGAREVQTSPTDPAAIPEEP